MRLAPPFVEEDDFFAVVRFVDDDFFAEDFFVDDFFDDVAFFDEEAFFVEAFFDDDPPFFEVDFFEEDDFFDDDLRAGVLSPSARASEIPMAMACLRLVTFRPDPPLFNFPSPYSCITFEIFFWAFEPYFVAMTSPFTKTRCTRSCASSRPGEGSANDGGY